MGGTASPVIAAEDAKTKKITKPTDTVEIKNIKPHIREPPNLSTIYTTKYNRYGDMMFKQYGTYDREL
jgi:hypothetical protein